MTTELKQIKGSDWEELVSSGIIAMELRNQTQWVLGDLALEVEKQYGRDSLGQYATAIGVKRATLARYRSVSKAWPPEGRIDMLSHRHHMILAAKEDKRELLEKCADNEWSTEKLLIELRKKKLGIENEPATSVLLKKTELETIIRWFTWVLDTAYIQNLSDIDNQLIEKIKNRLETVKTFRIDENTEKGKIEKKSSV